MLTVVTGPMFAGKSSKLISMATAHCIAGHYVLAFKASNDNRYDEVHITSHSYQKYPAVPIDPTEPLKILEKVSEFEHATMESVDVVVVDEAQFFSKDLIKVIQTLLYGLRKTIILSGLSQDSNGNPFGSMPHLLAIADDIIHLKAVCSKSKTIGTATRTFRKDVSNTSQVVVGGSETYEPRSFNEWLMESQPTI